MIPFLPGFLLFLAGLAGAGDCKLLMAAGSIVGRAAIGHFTFVSLLVASLYSIAVILARNSRRSGFPAFLRWLRACLVLRSFSPFPRRKDTSAFPFAVPVFITSLLYCSDLLGGFL